MKLEALLLEKARQGKLAHFYIVESAHPAADTPEKLLHFVHEFIRDYYQKLEGQKHPLQSLPDHPDVILLGRQEEDKKEAAFYSVTEAEALSRFFEWRPVQSKRKFAVIQDAHRINPTVANKWLKLFEEPPGESTIFLLNPRNQKLLPTLHSRALHLRLPSARTDALSAEWSELLKDLPQLTLSQYLETYSRGDYPLSFWVEELVRWEAGRDDQVESKLALAHWLKDFEEMETFHQPTATKWTLFYSHLKKHVLPRS
jgi:hypothetical protein